MPYKGLYLALLLLLPIQDTIAFDQLLLCKEQAIASTIAVQLKTALLSKEDFKALLKEIRDNPNLSKDEILFVIRGMQEGYFVGGDQQLVAKRVFSECMRSKFI